ncbi:MAG: SRPBCC family protein [Pseudomonadota bacterium]
MKLSTRQDVAAPIDTVFARVTDFQRFERQAMRRGISVTRADPPAGAPGPAWAADVTYRGRKRALDVFIETVEPTERCTALTLTSGVECRLEARLIALSPAETRMMVSIDMRPRTMAGRMFLQTLKLAKSTLAKRFEDRVAAFATEIGDATA